MKPDLKHKAVIQLLKKFIPTNTTAFAQIRDHPEAEACWSFFGNGSELLSAIKNGIFGGKEMGLIQFLRNFPKQISQKSIDSFSAQIDLLRQRESEEDQPSVSIFVLFGGGEDQAGVAEMRVQKVDRSEENDQIKFISDDYEYDQIDNFENALNGLRSVLGDRIDLHSFEVEIRKTAIIPANSGGGQIDGGSIGLPFAIAIYSLITGRHIPKALTATGAVSENGEITFVNQILSKIEKLEIYNRLAEPEIGLLIAPNVNQNEVDRHSPKDLRTKFFDSIGALFSSDLLIDRYRDHLETLSKFDQSTITADEHDLNFYRSAFDKKNQKSIFPISHGSPDPEPIAKFIAKLFAEDRLKKHSLGQQLPPIPAIFRADEIGDHNFSDLLRSKFSADFGVEDRFALIVHSAIDDQLKKLTSAEIENDRLIVIAENWHQMAKFGKLE